MDIYWGKGKNETKEPGHAATGVVQGENNGDIDDAGDSGEGQKWKSEEPLSGRVRSLGLSGRGRWRRRSKPRRILAWMDDGAVC